MWDLIFLNAQNIFDCQWNFENMSSVASFGWQDLAIQEFPGATLPRVYSESLPAAWWLEENLELST